MLGSFPGEASLAARQYYAHPRNHFWPILGALLDEPLADLPYASARRACARRGSRIWDTIVACERPGSLDASIRNAERGEVARIRRAAPNLRASCASTASTAARAEPVWREAGYATLVMPSTSPAYTRPMQAKLAQWRTLLQWL